MSRHHAILAALAASMAIPFDDSAPATESAPSSRRRGRDPLAEKPVNGPVIQVSRAVYEEVLKTHTLAQVNAMPYPERCDLIDAARRQVAERERQSGSDAAAQCRADRARRKAEAWAKRQPKAGA